MDDVPAAPGNAHVHRLPTSVRLALVGLTAAVFLALVGLGLMASAVYQADQYVQGRGEYRDRETARVERETRDRIRAAICDLLDQLPEGGLLDRPRAKYGCGPGIPFEALTPEEQERITGARGSPPPPLVRPDPPAPDRTRERQPIESPPSQSAPPPPPTPPSPEPSPTPQSAPQPAPAPESSSSPPTGLGPVIDLACELAGACPP